MLSSHTIVRRAIRIVPALFLALAASAAFLSLAEDSEVDRKKLEAEEDRARMAESLKILANGDAAARREVADGACSWFEALESYPFDEEQLNRVVEDLRRYVRREDDDWISARLVEEIGCHDPHILRPLFLDALASASPNLRRKAFHWFGDVEEPGAVPLLEEAWPGEKRPWARSDLIEALARNHSSRYLEEFRRLAEGEDPELSSAAIGAILLLKDYGAIPLLARLAREGNEWQRREASDALSVAPDSPMALDALLEASEDEDSRTRECALRSLARRTERTAVARALAVTVTDPEEEVRKAGVQGLESSPLRAVIHGILGAITWDQGADRDEVESLLLHSLGDLLGGTAGGGAAAPPGLRDDGRQSRCVFYPRGGLDPDNPRSMRVSPPAGNFSARCYEYPGVPGDPRAFWRVARGDLLFVLDHFEGRDGPWVRVHGFKTSNSCWLPASQVVPAVEEDSPDEEEGVLRRDFDMLPDDVWDPVFYEMCRANVAEILDSKEGRVAVSLRIRMGSLGDEALLRHTSSFPESTLYVNVFWMLEEAYTRLCDYPSMISLAVDLGHSITFCPHSPSVAPDPIDDLEP